mgnify:CR=1 FL=1
MPLTPPFIACRISDSLPDAVASLDNALQQRVKESQAALAGKLITEASCDLIDAFFGQLMLSLQAKDPGSPVFREAVAVVEDIKGKLRHYLGWVTGFFSNERLAPVVSHYRSLMTPLPVEGVPVAHLAFSISPGLAAEARVLGADTSVVLDGVILGKPLDRSDAQQMLRQLSGRQHQVLTAVALATADSCVSRLVTSRVSLRTISEAEIQAYWDTGEPQDKAGGYAIQGLAAIFVRAVHGSYSAVVGLPLCETAELLAAANIPCWQLRDNA